MAFQVGTLNLGNGATSGTATYPTAFAATPIPPMVIGVVENFIDGSPLLIHVQVTAVSATDFTFELSAATDSVNYVLYYLVGSPETLFAAATAIGKRGSQFAEFTGTLLDSDRLLLTRMTPLPQTYALTMAILKATFMGKLAAIPSGPTATSGTTVAHIQVDDDYLYIRTPTKMGRVGLSTVQWAVGDKALKRQEGSHICTQTKAQTITFPAAFTGVILPHVRWSLVNTAVGDKLLIYGMITGISLSGCEIFLTTEPDHASNYVIHYEAILPLA